MKLKHKWIKEWLFEKECEMRNRPYESTILPSEYVLLGFEKAREMAAKIAYSPDFDGTGDELDYIGEEEV